MAEEEKSDHPDQQEELVRWGNHMVSPGLLRVLEEQGHTREPFSINDFRIKPFGVSDLGLTSPQRPQWIGYIPPRNT